MILPSKYLPRDRALLTVGGQILAFLVRPKTVSALWEEWKQSEGSLASVRPRKISYDWFLLALDLLYVLGIIDIESGLVARRTA